MKIVVADLNERGIFRPIDEILGNRNVPNDTGLSNRLLVWELVKIINNIHNNKFEIIIDIKQNPETNNCVNLEDTKVKDVTKIDFSNYIPLTDKMIQDIFNGSLKLDNDKNYFTDFTKRHIHDFVKNYPTRFIKDLKFINDEINDGIKKVVQGCIGIHLRRGRGVRINDGNTIDLSLFEGWNHDILSDYIKMKVNDMPAWKHYQFDFIKDEVYFEKIDAILAKSPNQKFYISHDLDYSMFNCNANQRWLDKYSKNLVWKEDFYELLTSWEIPLELNTKNFLDLYALCNTRHIFTVPLSTWSELASDYNGKMGMDINSISNKDLLRKVYQKNLL